jgi:hypothetical protein
MSPPTRTLARYGPQIAVSALVVVVLTGGDEPLSNRILVLYEAAGMDSDLTVYFVKSLLSEGRLHYETVEKTTEGMKPRLIERGGPTGLIVTTTAVKLHPENETRLLSLTVTDTQEQTRVVMVALAEEVSGEPNVEEWRAHQRWLSTAEHRVNIPCAKVLAALIPPWRSGSGVTSAPFATSSAPTQSSSRRAASGMPKGAS